MATKKATKKCSYHCGGCHSHFSSLEAFDIHRTSSECWGGSDREADLRPATEDGICDMYAETRTGVTIYEYGPSADRARARFRS